MQLLLSYLVIYTTHSSLFVVGNNVLLLGSIKNTIQISLFWPFVDSTFIGVVRLHTHELRRSSNSQHVENYHESNPPNAINWITTGLWWNDRSNFGSVIADEKWMDDSRTPIKTTKFILSYIQWHYFKLVVNFIWIIICPSSGFFFTPVHLIRSWRKSIRLISLFWFTIAAKILGS